MSTFDLATGARDSEKGYKGSLLVSELTPTFLAGRAYRAYKAFTAATQLRFTATKPFILKSQVMYCDSGQATAVITAGSTIGGVWTALPTKFAVNGTVSPVPTPLVTLEEGGTITGGTERERMRAASGAGVGIVNSVVTPRLLPAGTYSIALTVTGSTTAIYSIEWEEFP